MPPSGQAPPTASLEPDAILPPMAAAIAAIGSWFAGGPARPDELVAEQPGRRCVMCSTSSDGAGSALQPNTVCTNSGVSHACSRNSQVVEMRGVVDSISNACRFSAASSRRIRCPECIAEHECLFRDACAPIQMLEIFKSKFSMPKNANHRSMWRSDFPLVGRRRRRTRSSTVMVGRRRGQVDHAVRALLDDLQDGAKLGALSGWPVLGWACRCTLAAPASAASTAASAISCGVNGKRLDIEAYGSRRDGQVIDTLRLMLALFLAGRCTHDWSLDLPFCPACARQRGRRSCAAASGRQCVRGRLLRPCRNHPVHIRALVTSGPAKPRRAPCRTG